MAVLVGRIFPWLENLSQTNERSITRMYPLSRLNMLERLFGYKTDGLCLGSHSADRSCDYGSLIVRAVPGLSSSISTMTGFCSFRLCSDSIR